jgi:hypothetical protein
MENTEWGRFKEGMVAGVGATLAAGAVSLLMLVLHLWPSDRPLSVMVANDILNKRMNLGASTAMLYVVAGAAQLIYGAFCGGMLAFLSNPIARWEAVGMGAIRWSSTQILTAPTLGWGDFGMFGINPQPLIGLYTFVPHAAFTAVAWWLIRQEETERVPLWRQVPRSLHAVHLPARLRHPFTSGRGPRRP